MSRATSVVGALANRRPVADSPITGQLSQQRRFVTVRTDLADYRTIRQVHGGTVNDVILATVTGALRNWLMTRAESLGGLRVLKAVVPMSVIDDDLEATSLGTQIAPHLVELPIGEASPVVRLHQVSYSFEAHQETGRAVAANRLAGIAGFAPTTFHALGSRVAAAELRRGFHLSVTNVPGPQFPLYAAGARMVETYPVQPLLPGPRTGHRGHLLRRRGVLRHHGRPRRPPRRRRPRPVPDRGAGGAQGHRDRGPDAGSAGPQETAAGLLTCRGAVP